jgi:hypothetical protein
MSNEANPNELAAEEIGETIVAVPPEQAQAVLDFIASLESQEEDDVRGHMIVGGFGPLAGANAAHGKRTTGSGCVWDPLQKKFVCGDID